MNKNFVGALPQTPQGTLSLDSAKGLRPLDSHNRENKKSTGVSKGTVSLWQSARQSLAILTAIAVLTCQPLTALADSLEDEKADYDQRAEVARQKSNEIQAQIDTVSEEKRLIDEEADAAIAAYKSVKAVLDETLERIERNEALLAETEEDFRHKTGALGKRVRNIYVHGQISYLDVLFGAKDFSDFMTRMDLLKRIIKQDYDLVQVVLAEKLQIEETQAALEKDRQGQEAQVKEAEDAKEVMLAKQAKRQAIIDRMENDKAVYDRQYEELMAASKQVEEMIRRSRYQPATASAPVTGGGGGGMIWPIAGPITSEFGWRTHPIFGNARFHSGIDIGGEYGLPIAAAASGVVSYAGWISGYGNTVIIDHGGGVSSLYGHNQSLAVGEGQSVSQGETIAYCGSTGNSTGPHCHFEVRQNGEPVSPYNYL
ncbi:MAG: peptidoglycan DD-metalloendopeptidase family protein [Selenomonadaceae bacterium]|nr:peptidoglycan DD-metalloendopeptidase family protein [Selenomonadaceae bacterium]